MWVCTVCGVSCCHTTCFTALTWTGYNQKLIGLTWSIVVGPDAPEPPTSQSSPPGNRSTHATAAVSSARVCINNDLWTVSDL